jgi:hypothetical protein
MITVEAVSMHRRGLNPVDIESRRDTSSENFDTSAMSDFTAASAARFGDR